MNKKLIKKFKKVSSLDIIALFTIFFITASAYFFLSRKTEYLDITIKLFDHDAPEYAVDSNLPKSWHIEQIEVGKAQKNQFGEKLIEIIDVYSYPNAFVYNDVYVTLKVKAIQNKITKQYLFEGSPLLIHDIRTFKIQDLLLHGEIIDISEKERETKKFKIVLELLPKNSSYVNNSDSLILGLKNYIADLFVEGLVIKDSKNTELVKVRKVEKKPGERIIANTNGLIKYPDTDRTQVFLHIDLLAERINNYYFYRKKETLAVGENLWLNFDEVNVVGTILSIEEY